MRVLGTVVLTLLVLGLYLVMIAAVAVLYSLTLWFGAASGDLRLVQSRQGYAPERRVELVCEPDGFWYGDLDGPGLPEEARLVA